MTAEPIESMSEPMAMQPAPALRAKSGGLGWLPWLLALLIGMFALGMIASPWFEHTVRGHLPAALRSVGEASQSELSLTQRAQNERIASLEARLKTLEASQPDTTGLAARIARLETGVLPQTLALEASAPAEPTLDTAKLDTRLTTLETKLAAVPTQATDLPARVAQVESQLADIGRRTGDLEASATQTVASLKSDAAQARRLGLVASARQAVESGQPLGALRARLDEEFADKSLLSALEPRADGGPTVAGLRQQLVSLQPQLEDAWRAYNTGGEASWLDSALARLGNIVRLERRDAPRRVTVGSAVVAADSALAQGKVGLAAEKLRALPQAVRRPADAWLRDADALARTQMTLAKLEVLSLERRP